LPIYQLSWENENQLSFYSADKKYRINLNTYEITPLKTVDSSSSISPNGKWKAFIKSDNLYIKNLETGSVKQLSQNGTSSYIYGSLYGWGQIMEGENAEPKPRLHVVWSPDSHKILTQITDTREGKKL